jgi:hypothetical protein
MLQFGPVWNLWEGGDQGEKIIRVMKPLWFMYRKNWEVNLMTNVLNMMAIDRKFNAETRKQEKKCANNCERNIEETIGLEKKMVHKYVSLAAVVDKYDNRKPLSMVQLREGRFVCIIRRSNLFVELYCGSHIEFLGG